MQFVLKKSALSCAIALIAPTKQNAITFKMLRDIQRQNIVVMIARSSVDVFEKTSTSGTVYKGKVGKTMARSTILVPEIRVFYLILPGKFAVFGQIVALLSNFGKRFTRFFSFLGND